MKKLLLLLLCAFSNFVYAQSSSEKLSCEGSIREHDFSYYKEHTMAKLYENDDAQSMPYRLFLPEGYDPQKEYPIILVFHGAGSRGDDNLRQLRPWIAGWTDEELQKSYTSIILIPQCPAGEQWVNVPWSDGSYQLDTVPVSQPMQLAKEILDQTIADYSVDKDRVYVMGMSMGGYATWNFTMLYPELVAAAIPICGAGDPTKASKIKSVPINLSSV